MSLENGVLVPWDIVNRCLPADFVYTSHWNTQKAAIIKSSARKDSISRLTSEKKLEGGHRAGHSLRHT